MPSKCMKNIHTLPNSDPGMGDAEAMTIRRTRSSREDHHPHFLGGASRLTAKSQISGTVCMHACMPRLRLGMMS
jgi:hypothetical protein